jgi:hypothetical protein
MDSTSLMSGVNAADFGNCQPPSHNPGEHANFDSCPQEHVPPNKPLVPTAH